MNININFLLKKLKTRFSLNLYFWILLIYSRLAIPFQNDLENSISILDIYLLLVVNLSILVGCVYWTLLVLVPLFITKNKLILFVITSFVSIYIFAFFYTYLMKLEKFYFPNLDLFSVSISLTTQNLDFSLSTIFKEMNRMYLFNFQTITYGFVGAWYLREFYKKEKEIKEIKQAQNEFELNFLKSQLNPHFLFNTLNNIYGLSVLKSEFTSESILKLSSLLRYLLYESNESLVTFEKEKLAMQAYIDLELLRIKENQNFNFSISSDSETEIPPLLWLPILENVFKHGNFTHESSMIDYRFTVFKNELVIYSKNLVTTLNHTDNNIGGIGLVNLEHRLKLIYKNNYTLEKKLKEKYFIVSLKINLNHGL